MLKCAENLWYSEDREECEWPERANCKKKTSYSVKNLSLCMKFIGKVGHLYTSSTSATNMVDSEGNILTAPPKHRPTNVYLPIECPPRVQDHFPDPYDCSVFHYCNGILIILIFCSDHLILYFRWC